MATKSQRSPPPPSPASPPPSSASGSSHPHTPKLPRFLQRDRAKSVAGDTGSLTNQSTASSSSSSSSPPTSLDTHAQPAAGKSRKGIKKVIGLKERDKERTADRRMSQDDGDEHALSPTSSVLAEPGAETPVIVEPVNIPRPRTRSERPISDSQYAHASTVPSYYPSTSSSRISDLPTRLSGWFHHTFSASSTDLSLPALLSQQHLSAGPATGASPKGKGSALLTAARHGKGHIDKAMRYLLDSDATPDKCTHPIWLLGVEHPGYEPPPPPSAMPALSASAGPTASLGRRSSVESRRSPASQRSSASSSPVVDSMHLNSDNHSRGLSQSQPPSPNASNNSKDPSRHWPPVFYSDFTSRIWLTYRSQFQPIRDTSLNALEWESEKESIGDPGTSPQPKRWNWLGGEKGWTSDAGWGCMLRTGQSLLANSLLHLHLGRDWRRPPYPVYTADYATYVQILTWFFDNPSPLAPFSVHRMALVGKELGKDVGQWFGPSTAAGAIKTLVHAFPEAGLGVSVAADGVVYQSDVYAVSRSTMRLGSPRRGGKHGLPWGDRGVLVLIGIRLGLDGVNPVYYDTIKALYTFPQSVGIAGGRPSSSYYFVGSQADNLFYLDPHHARPAIPLRPPPRFNDVLPLGTPDRREHDRQGSMSPDSSYSPERERDRRGKKGHHFRSPTTPTMNSRSGGGSAFTHRSPVTPSPLQQQISTSSAASSVSGSPSHSQSSSSSQQPHARWQSYSGMPDVSMSGEMEPDLDHLDPLQRHYVTAYSAAELKTFHCDRVRKMPLSGLDPSMLIGFLCKDEADWIDFRRRITELSKTHKTMFYIHDEPPNWPSDSEDNIGLESISEPDIDLPEEDDEDFAHSPSESPSPDAASEQGTGSVAGSKSEVDTEDDPIDPVTPGAGKSSFDIPEREPGGGKPVGDDRAISPDNSLDFDDEEDEEWMDPSPYPSPTPPEARSAANLTQQAQRVHAPPMKESISTSSTLSTSSAASMQSKKRKKGKKGKSPSQQQAALQYPFPATHPGEDAEESGAGAGANGGKRVPQMRTAKARDGGRTQSGGIRGVPTDDCDDF